jgi:dienelactone hydrolase
MLMRRLFWLWLVLAAGCAGDDEAGPSAPSPYEAEGPFAPGHVTLQLVDAARGRPLTVEVWYPAAGALQPQALAGEPIESYVTDATLAGAFKTLVDKAPNPGTSRRLHGVRDAAIDLGQARWPIVAFSHCFNCVRFSTATVAERLASHGIAVIAPDHAGGTFFDDMRGHKGNLNNSFLEVRAADIRFALDVALGATGGLPAGLQGRFDPDRVGVYGHSFGGVTTGRVLNLDERPKAGLALAVPMDLMPGVDLSLIRVPLFFLVAVEDNSITEIGNRVIRDDFARANPPVWKVELKDAGHLSVTNICGIDEGFLPGCEAHARRQTDPGETFEYLDIDVARGITASYVTAFFAGHLRGEAGALAYLEGAHPPRWVEAASRK